MLPLGKKVIIFDGAMGSELERLGLTQLPEDLNVTHPDVIRGIHRSYSCADCITTNTFGLNGIKYNGRFTLGQVADAAIANARAVGKAVFFDVGPTGKMLRPIGQLDFDEAYEAYRQIAELTRDGVDGYICETFSDLNELKACVLALKEHTDKPVYATMTFGENGRTLTGTTPEIASAVLCGLGVDAVGVNCSPGPEQTEPVVRRFVNCCAAPVIVQPNRGLPSAHNGVAQYDVSADEFVKYARRFVKMGASVIGGCCGTTPEFIRAISALGGTEVRRKKVKTAAAICSATKITDFCGVRICGERINPTGKPKLKEALISGDYDYIADEAVKQTECGADVLDVNVGLPEIDEAEAMKNAVIKISEYVNTPLCIDSSSAQALENGLRYYCGIAIVNSVNGDREVMDRVFPIAARYGAAVLGLTADGGGVPSSAAERVAIAEKIIERAAFYNIPKSRIIIDALTLTAAAEQQKAGQTLSALRAVKKLGVKTALGVSNISFGLPNRPLLNRTFLTAAMQCGLDMPILNPSDGEMIGAVRAFKVLSGEDGGCARYINAYKNATAAVLPSAPVAVQSDSSADLYGCILNGHKNKAALLCRNELASAEPMDIVNNVIMRALDEVGKRYGGGEIFLPQLVASAEAAKNAFEVITSVLPKGGGSRGKVLLATVKGDVHDIGKNIVKVVLQSYGYNVIDLGKDTPIKTVTDAYLLHKPIAVGLSALMTTTVPNMKLTIQALRNVGCDKGIYVGGAVLSPSLAREIGADGYTSDALELAKLLNSGGV